MAEDDQHKIHGFGKGYEAAQCVIIANVVISSEAGPDSSSIKVAIHHIARTKRSYFYHLSMARPSLVLVSPCQLVWFHFGAKT